MFAAAVAAVVVRSFHVTFMTTTWPRQYGHNRRKPILIVVTWFLTSVVRIILMRQNAVSQKIPLKMK